MTDASKIAATGEEAPDIVVGDGGAEEGEEPAQGEGAGEASTPEEEGSKGRRRRPKREE